MTERLIREGSERLIERRPMAMSTLIGMASLALTLAITAGGLIATYGAWSRSEGERTAFERYTGQQVQVLQAAKDAAVIKLALLEQAKGERDKQVDILVNKFDEYRAYVQALTVRMAAAGVRDLPPPPQ
jgi:hypothetical protein